ncbi:TIM barrel protein [Candidatus Poribacteria bacterium]|nr:TIM barrel protein [Candidatus Poribacteria bacterium]
MYLSIFTDELGVDITEGLPIIKSWGLEYVDLRGRVFGKAAEALPPEKLPELRKLIDDHGMKVGCLQSSLAKVHLPDKERQKAEAEKLEGIIRAADALDCRMVRSFFYWQPPRELAGQLAVRPDEQQKVLDMFGPLAERAKEAGLIMTFENCGVTADEVITIVDALGVTSWGLAWDVCNGWNDEERRKDEDAYILRLAQLSKLLHVKAQCAIEGLGDETIPYDKVLNICHNAGLPGPVSVETHNPDRSISNVEMSKQVVDVLKKAWPSAAPGGLFEENRSDKGIVRPWSDDPVGFVVVGLGMGHSRAKQVKNTTGNRLIGVCDIVEERAKRTAEECDVPYTTDLKEWLDNDEVEVIYVVTETGNHAEVAIQALEAGKHVLSTKPMEASLEACDREIRKAEEKGLILGIDFDRRFVTETHTLRACIKDGMFGKLLYSTCGLKVLRTMAYFNSNGGWRGTRRWDGGGVLSNQAIHNLDEVAFTLGIPARVKCDIWTQNHDIEAEDLGTAVWEYNNGLIITYYATTCYPHSTWYRQYEVSGTEGAYFSASGGPFQKSVIRWFYDNAWADRPPIEGKLEWINATDNFAAAVRGEGELLCPGREGRKSQSILDAMYRSAYEADGGWVDVNSEL